MIMQMVAITLDFLLLSSAHQDAGYRQQRQIIVARW